MRTVVYSVVLTPTVIKGVVVFRKRDQFSFTACLKRTNFYSRPKAKEEPERETFSSLENIFRHRSFF